MKTNYFYRYNELFSAVPNNIIAIMCLLCVFYHCCSLLQFY